MGAAGVGSEVSYLFNGEYLGIASAILTLLVLVLSEVIPKTLGARYCNALAKPGRPTDTLAHPIALPCCLDATDLFQAHFIIRPS